MSWSKELVRTLQAPTCLLPDFMIIGAMKCGTSSLFHYLAAHPNVASSKPKEVHYFDDHYDSGLRWYRKHFPSRLSKVGKDAIRCGEASPYYLFDPEVPARVHATLPDVRLIAMFRDPVARAYSHFHHATGNGLDDRTFEEAIDAELAYRASGGSEPLHPTHEPAFAQRRLQYLGRGLYAEQLSRWLEVFPAERILSLRSEDMFADPLAVYNAALEHLALPAFEPKKFKQRNIGKYKDPVAPATRDRLQAFYEPHVRALESMLGRAMEWGY